MPLFSDPLHQEFAEWALGFAPYGGADVGELEVIAGKVTAGDDGSFLEAFEAMARERIAEGDAAAAKGRRATAADAYLRAACYLGVGYHPLYGVPVDPRLVDAFHLQMDAFAKYATNSDPAGEAIDVPYEGTKIPAYLFRAPGHEHDVRPTILVGGGWDSTMVENHLGMGVAALRRGYHVLLHDGPGQGRLLVDEGLPLRFDWEKVVTPVVDAALKIDVVDPARIAYEPWSLGGYMAPRVAAFEHRLAAVIADPGQMYVGNKMTPLIAAALGADAAAKLPQIAPADADKLMGFIRSNRSMDWKVERRGFWTNGAKDLASWIAEMEKWNLDAATVAAVRSPMLVAAAQSDGASADAKQLYDALTGPKTFTTFSDADGAGMHCELLNRSLANRRFLDWLDDTLGPTPAAS